MPVFLTATTDTLELVTSAACSLDVHVSYADVLSGTTISQGRQNYNITTATTTTILTAPAASTVRNLRTFNARNKHATNPVDITLQFNQNATVFELHKVTLQAGEALEYVEGIGWFLLSARSQYYDPTTVEVDAAQRVLMSMLPKIATFVMISGTAYYVYVGRTVKPITVAFVEMQISSAGAGAQTAEVGLYTTSNPPNKSAQTLTRLVATGTVNSMTATGACRNTTTFAQAVPANTHLWAAARTAMATTQPTVCAGLVGDCGQGHILTTTGGGALTGVSSASGVLVSATVSTAIGPDLRVTLD